MADKKFSDFTDGGEMQLGDQIVGLRSSFPTNNFRFNFPGDGFKDNFGNYLLRYDSAGVSAVNSPLLKSSLSSQPVFYSAAGSDADISISIQPVGNGELFFHNLRWPTSDGAPGTLLTTDGAGTLSFTSYQVNTGIIGTPNQIFANGTTGMPITGTVTLTLPQDIDIAATPEFSNIKLTGPAILDENSNIILNFDPIPNAVNYILINNNIISEFPIISCDGTNTDISIQYESKGLGSHIFRSNGNDPILIESGTSNQHVTTFLMPNTAAFRTVAFQDASGTMAYLTDIPSGSPLTANNDTNITLTLGGLPNIALINAASITAGWSGLLSLSRGGTNASLTPSNGGIVYSTASSLSILPGTPVANRVLLSGASSSPSFSTATYPATASLNGILYASAANTISQIPTNTQGVLTTNGTGVPSITGPLNNNSILIGSSSTTIAQIPTANRGVLTTSTSGVPSISTPLNDGEIIIGSTSGNPAPANLVAGTNISILNGPNSITISGATTTIGTQVFLSSGTYTPTPGMNFAEIQVIGGGGAGGGAPAASAASGAAGGGGGSGGYSTGIFTALAIGASKPVTIGAGGTGVAGAGGNAGSPSSVGALITANGGAGGNINLATLTAIAAIGGAGATPGTGGSQNSPGSPGSPAFTYGPACALSGIGASTRFGGGAIATTSLTSQTNGVNASANTGGGGSGSSIRGVTGTTSTGGQGGSGIVVIREFI